MESIQQRLNLQLGLALLLVYVLFGVAASYSFRLLTEHYIAARLEHDAESLLVSLVPGADSQGFVLQRNRINPIYERVFSGHYYQIETPHQMLRSRSLWDQALEMPQLDIGQSRLYRRRGPEDQLLLVWMRHYTKLDQPVLVAVAEDLTPIRSNVRRFQLFYVLTGLVVLVGLLAFQRHILRRSFAPVDRARQELIELQQGELEHLNERVPRELHPLVFQINRMLEVMHKRLARSRNALGNLAHALKTPLARLNQELDHQAGEMDPQTRERIQQQLDQIRQLMERELKRARLAGKTFIGGRLPLAPVFAGLVGVLKQVYADKALKIEVAIPETAVIQADREDMMELFGNLLDNACKWARSRIRIDCEQRGEELVISIEDDGPGVAPSQRERLRQRGVRIDEGGVDGHGLGLAIAEDVISHYGGRLEFDESAELGGFSVSVWFPLSADRP